MYHYLDLGSASDLMKQIFNQSDALPTCYEYGITTHCTLYSHSSNIISRGIQWTGGLLKCWFNSQARLREVHVEQWRECDNSKLLHR